MDSGKLQFLLDRMDISDTVIRYATGIDMRDWEAYRCCFTEDVEIDFSSFPGGSPERLSAELPSQRPGGRHLHPGRVLYQRAGPDAKGVEDTEVQADRHLVHWQQTRI